LAFPGDLAWVPNLQTSATRRPSVHASTSWSGARPKAGAGGLSLDREERRAAERDRIRAVKQVRAGRNVKDVAEILGHETSTVYRWLRWYDQGGFEALKESKAPGKPPLLSLKQMARLRAVVIGSDPRQLRFEFALWTREIIGELIEREFGVTMSGRFQAVAASPCSNSRVFSFSDGFKNPRVSRGRLLSRNATLSRSAWL